MSSNQKQILREWGPVVLAALAAARVFSMSDRLDATEKDVAQIKIEKALDHEMLGRIDERTKAIKEIVDRLQASRNTVAVTQRNP